MVYLKRGARTISTILAFVGIAGIGHDLKVWSSWFAKISNHLPDMTSSFWMVMAALIMFFAPNWWEYVARKRSANTKEIIRTEDLQEPATQPNRVYSAKTPDEIFEAIRDMNSLQIDRFASPFIGKWLQVQGFIGDIYEIKRVNLVHVRLKLNRDRWDVKSILLQFDKSEWLPVLETMDTGDPLKVEGTIKEIANYKLQIENCEIL